MQNTNSIYLLTKNTKELLSSALGINGVGVHNVNLCEVLLARLAVCVANVASLVEGTSSTPLASTCRLMVSPYSSLNYYAEELEIRRNSSNSPAAFWMEYVRSGWTPYTVIQGVVCSPLRDSGMLVKREHDTNSTTYSGTRNTVSFVARNLYLGGFSLVEHNKIWVQSKLWWKNRNASRDFNLVQILPITSPSAVLVWGLTVSLLK